MVLRIGIRALALAALLAALSVSPALAVPTVAGEFAVSDLETNSKITAGPDGNMWVAVSGEKEDVAKITPSGDVHEYNFEATSTNGIVAGPNGLMWITHPGGVISFKPGDPEGTFKETEIKTINGNSPMVLAPDGNIWVATSELLIRIPPAKPEDFKEFEFKEVSPTDLEVSGSLLVVGDAGNHRVLTATIADPPVITDEVAAGGSVQGVAAGPNGQIAYTQPVEEPKTIGLFTPPSKTPLTVPEAKKDPFGIVFATDLAYWSPERNDDKLIRITTDGKTSELFGFAKGSSPRQIAVGPGNTLWVTLDENNKVAKVTGVDPPAPPIVNPPKPTVEPRTTITKGPKGRVKTPKSKKKVKFSFESPDAGATFECRVVAVLKKKRAKASKVADFKPCTSPKSATLKVGKYRFEVRAVLAGVVDQTPAMGSFQIVRTPPKHVKHKK